MAQVQIVPFIAKITHSQLWVGSPAVPISGSNMEGRKEMLITANAGQVLFLGSAGVTMNNGTPLAIGDNMSVPFAGSVFIWGVGSGTGSTDVRIMEFA